MDQVKPLKQVSEGIRERETFRYYSSLLRVAKFNNTGRSLPSSELSTSNDSILTALAQLGTCQTGTERALVSLFDVDRQYIIAEATPSISLRPSLRSSDCCKPLGSCGTAIPRSHGACEIPLLGTPSAHDITENEGHDSTQLPLTLSQDLTTDARFASKRNCQPGGATRFYAAVPIRTRRGINIGVYCVMNSTAGGKWNDEYTGRLREISQTIMDHLESQRLKESSRRSDRMNKGLGYFIEGKSTISDSELGRGDSLEKEDALNPTKPASQHKQDPQAMQAHAATAEIPTEFPAEPPRHEETPSTNSSTWEDMDHQSGDGGNPTAIFSKAANIIRESIDVEGCLFFDATMSSYRLPSTAHGTGEALDPSSSGSSHDEPLDSDSGEELWPRCQLLGSSTSDSVSPEPGAVPQPSPRVAEQFLAKLLRRYPKGKIFNFGADGALQSSDSSEDDGAFLSSSLASPPPSQKGPGDSASPSSRSRRSKKPWARQREGSVLLKAFPEARSVAFVPIWDPRKERWYAGGFIYTNSPSRNFSLQGELNYLMVFGMLAIAEILRYNTLLENKAKSDALGSLSHELRSPLHGVLLSAELLMDTDLNVFQGNAAHTIETCSRTLLDTIDHLLDYSKINNFAKGNNALKNALAAPVAGAQVDWNHFGQKSLICNCRLDGLVEEVMESVFAGFHFQHLSAQPLSEGRPRSKSSEVRANHHLDFLQAREQLDPRLINSSELQLNFGQVSIFLSVDPSRNWSYLVQVGAFRRIIMNLFGNALKYTHKGRIKVSLTQETMSLRQRKKESVVKVTVQDTGRGIGADFLKQGLFKPFSQEDTLAPGTGLGLSLVKQITSQLGGQISLESQVGVGTTVSVALPLEQVPQQLGDVQSLSEEDQEFDARVRDLKGLRVRMMYPAQGDGADPDGHKDKLEGVCTGWLHMELVSDGECGAVAPDLLIWSQDSLPKSSKEIEALSSTPNIVICPNSLEAYIQSHSFEAAGHTGIFEFLSQPIGPRKLSKTLLLAYKRWTGLPKSRGTGTTSPPVLVKRPAGPNRTPSSFTIPDVSEVELVRVPSKSEGENPPSMEVKDVPTAPPPGTETLIHADFCESPSDLALPTPGTQFLLVDDNHINLKLLSAFMTKLGHQYQTAMNGKEAVTCFVKNPRSYSCVLMDISMPVMDGFEATRRIRAYECQEELQPVSIIALSGLASEDAQREAFGSGMDLFLSKPVKLKSLGALLESKNLLNG